ncbi:MAG: DUF1269 domain-containing protein [Candidatus Obscuribacterales bacterium]|nr:DUF1269 domain-containing protein [Candidatus Obscuribacterales bacterium]
MSHLVVIGYDDMHKASEVKLELLKLQQDYLIDLEDAVVAVKKPDGKIQLNQAINLTAYGAAQGSFLGLLIGALFLSPFFGAVLGAASGAIAGGLSDVGINDAFMKELASTLKPGSSALFVLVKSATPDKVAEKLQGTGGKLLKTSLSHEDETKLQTVLDEAKKVTQTA